MNYGKFFKLSQRLSKIEEGVAIYDYMDLPAYFDSGDISKNISPKYPISIAITEDCVRFRVHYSVYKIENSESPNYSYDVEGAFTNDGTSLKESSLKHIEETILELPYANDSTDKLSKAIKYIYNTKYPLTNNYIANLIGKRYNGENTKGLEKSLYDNLRKNYDEDVSYSTLWLMGLRNGCNVNLYDNENKDKEKRTITGFLRKLLLDFMFDLKHADVFQTSKFYQQMHSGLMCNFFFSALTHKCEYYYQRGLVEDLVGRNINDKQKKEHVRNLYAEKLFEDEELWINDIMNSEAEKHFMYYHDNYGLLNKPWHFLFKVNMMFKPYQFKIRKSWFAAPEEEMRRVCFTTEDSNGKHACNMESLCHYLGIMNSKDTFDAELLEKKDDVQAKISNWFLKRYAIGDVMHIHLFRGADIVILGLLTLLICGIFIFADFFTESFWESLYKPMTWITVAAFCVILLLLPFFSYINKTRHLKRTECSAGYGRRLSGAIFSLEKQKIAFKRTLNILLLIAISALIISYIGFVPRLFGWSTHIDESAYGTFLKLFTILLSICCIYLLGAIFNKYIFHIRWLANMHIFMPRLVASIAAAWLSLAIGNELFGTFFDSTVSWSTCIWLLVIVFAFVMYEIDILLRKETVYKKFERCIEIMIISYAVSIVIGMFIINFTGERFLERSGQLEPFFSQYVNSNEGIREVEGREYSFIMPNSQTKQEEEFSSREIDVKFKKIDVDSANSFIHIQGNLLVKDNRERERLSDAERLKKLSDVYIVPHSIRNSNPKEQHNHPISTIRELPGGGKFFILRDFLIQFSFVAMFIGIFITMLFEGKSITEV